VVSVECIATLRSKRETTADSDLKMACVWVPLPLDCLSCLLNHLPSNADCLSSQAQAVSLSMEFHGTLSH
jgi:hypothetical protein